MKTSTLEKRLQRVQQDTYDLATTEGRSDGIDQVPKADSSFYPSTYSRVHDMCKNEISYIAREITPILDSAQSECSKAEANLKHFDQRIKEKKEDNALSIQASMAARDKGREIVASEPNRINEQIRIAKNDQKRFERANYRTIKLGLLPMWLIVIFELFIVFGDAILMAGNITNLLAIGYLEGMAITLFPMLCLILLPYVNSYYLKGYFQNDGKGNQRFLLVVLIVGNFILLSALTYLFKMRSESLIAEGMHLNLDPDIFRFIMIGIAYLSVILAFLLSYISTPSADGKKYKSYDREVRKLRRARRRAERKIMRYDRKTAGIIKGHTKLKQYELNQITKEKLHFATGELELIKNYNQHLVNGNYAYENLKRSQRSAFIAYVNANIAQRNGAPFPNLQLDEAMKYWDFSNPFEVYKKYSHLEQQILVHMEGKSKRPWWRMASMYSVVLISLMSMQSCSLFPKPEATESIIVIADGTEQGNCDKHPSSKYLVNRVTGIDPQSNKISGKYGDIHFFVLNGSLGYEVVGSVIMQEPSSMYSQEKAISRGRIQYFYSQVDSLHQETCSRLVGAAYSRIFTNVISILTDHPKPSDRDQVVFLCSDLQEHSVQLKSYKMSADELASREEKITAALMQDVVIPDLTGRTIIIQNPTEAGKRDEAHAVFNRIYTKLFRKAGARVTTYS